MTTISGDVADRIGHVAHSPSPRTRTARDPNLPDAVFSLDRWHVERSTRETMSTRPSHYRRARPGRRARAAWAIVAVTAASVTWGGGVTLAAFPSQGAGAISNGIDRVALFTPDGSGVAVYDPQSGDQIGLTATLPSNAQGHVFRLFTTGIVGDRVYLAGDDPDRLPTTKGVHDHLASVDSATGSFRWLCAPPYTPEGAGLPACLREPPSGADLQITHVGRRWMLARTADPAKPALVRYRDSGGVFSQRFATAAERRRFFRDVPRRNQLGPLDLDGARVTLDRRWGFRRSLASIHRGTFGSSSYREGVRVVLGRSGDRHFARIDVLQRTRIEVPFVSFGARGMCASVGKRAILWDNGTRRIWRRVIPDDTSADASVCTTSNVLIGSATGFDFPQVALGPLWSWPTAPDPAGWSRGPILRPGDRRTA
jgi:hypothetical protein